MATVVVTGANRGIGLEIARIYKERGDDVIGACRSTSSDLDELGVEVVQGVDVGSDEGIGKLAAAVGSRKVDVLVNNAGILESVTFENLDLDAMRKQYEINTLGPLRVTRALIENLGADSKVGLVTSRMGSIADNTSGGSYGYRASKAALNMVGVSLAHDLRGRGIAVILLHPGFVRTGMTGNNGHIDTPESAAGLVARLDDLSLDTTGSFYHQNGEELPW